MNLSYGVILSGCSGGGKSTLLSELADRGFATVPEPGRRIVREELIGDGSALPWVNLAAFAERAIEIAARDLEIASSANSWTFFDRGLVDAAVALQFATGKPATNILSPYPKYCKRVFLAPPWPEIYRRDDERPHHLDEAIAEYERLIVSYRDLEYEPIILPKASVAERAEFVLSRLE